ncbi:MAG: DMT family transporter [Proteobacteria bacterium]|nr:DMT family transporter [Pseudomonadota bacterium]
MKNPLLKSSSILKSDSILLVAAVIWGFGFVAQKEGMNHVGPYTFNALRFAMGAIVVLLVALIKDRKKLSKITKKDLSKGLLAGLILFLASTFQQVGLIYTTAGSGGFISGIYVVIVPALGFLMWKQKIGKLSILGVILAIVGLYFLSINSEIQIKHGDLLILVSAFLWAYYVLLIGRFAPKMSAFVLAMIQFSFCSFFSFIMVFLRETLFITSIVSSSYSLLYSGILSVGIAFTLQTVGQKKSPPTHAAIIMSFEALFAVIGGWLILSEPITVRILIGCTFMLCGMFLSQSRK